MEAQITTPSQSPASAENVPGGAGSFVGSIPDDYDRHLGPVLFDFSARDMASRVAAQVRSGAKVLEIACGTGIATEYLWQALGPRSEIVATDLSQPMLDYAVHERGHLPGVSFRQASADALPFDDNSFDALVCQFGIMFFPDKAAAMAEFARVLRPGGLLAFSVWDSHERNQVAGIAHRVIGSFFESDPPDFLAVPFSYHDVDEITRLVRGGGFKDVIAHGVPAVVQSADPTSIARGFVQGNPGVLQIRERGTSDPEEIVAALAQRYEEAFGPAPFDIELKEITFLATKGL